MQIGFTLSMALAVADIGALPPSKDLGRTLTP
jgi:hypothetical protein